MFEVDERTAERNGDEVRRAPRMEKVHALLLGVIRSRGKLSIEQQMSSLALLLGTAVAVNYDSEQERAEALAKAKRRLDTAFGVTVFHRNAGTLA